AHALDVVVVRVRDEGLRDAQAARLDLFQEAVDLPGRVDDGRLARVGAEEDLAEVLQQSHLDLDDLGRRRQRRRERGVRRRDHHCPRTLIDAAPTLSALSQARTVTSCGPGVSAGSLTVKLSTRSSQMPSAGATSCHSAPSTAISICVMGLAASRARPETN